MIPIEETETLLSTLQLTAGVAREAAELNNKINKFVEAFQSITLPNVSFGLHMLTLRNVWSIARSNLRDRWVKPFPHRTGQVEKHVQVLWSKQDQEEAC